jgi:hypothetical protein
MKAHLKHIHIQLTMVTIVRIVFLVQLVNQIISTQIKLLSSTMKIKIKLVYKISINSERYESLV